MFFIHPSSDKIPAKRKKREGFVESGSDKKDDAPPGAQSSWNFRVSEPEEVSRHFLTQDATGQLFATLHYMSTVEDWVLQRLGADSPELNEQVRVRLQRLDAVIEQFRAQIPPDNASFLKILSWLSISQCMYTVEYLHLCQRSFFEQLIEHCRAMSNDDLTARFTFERIMTLLRTRLLDRILGPDNTDFVTRILLETAA
ncbi:hypothetical protein [Burkholderia pseudomallei]|uniref:type IVB secretion system protein IcmW n=1 Tax=Burkholderia pseudomallei TaxID=28450 RepID=UPI0012F4AA21|nr:hypothetical protein [Burkholderia pseudomallei]